MSYSKHQHGFTREISFHFSRNLEKPKLSFTCRLGIDRMSSARPFVECTIGPYNPQGFMTNYERIFYGGDGMVSLENVFLELEKEFMEKYKRHRIEELFV